MVNPIAWFAVKVLICIGTVPDLPILNSEVFFMSAPLSAFGGKKVSTWLYWYKNPDTGSHSIPAQCGSGVSGRTVVGHSARLLPAAFASLLFASLSAALRVPALPYAVYVGFVCGIALVGPCPLLARFQSFDSVLVLLSMLGRVLRQCSFLDISCCNEMHGCWHGAAMVASAAALLYPSLKFVVQAAAAVPAAAKDENYVPCCLFVVGGVFTTALLLASAAFVSEGINMRMEQHAVAASAAALVSKNAHDCSFVSAGVLELLSLLEPAAAFVGLSEKIFMLAVAASAAAFLCKSSVILLENEMSELPWSCAGLFLFISAIVCCWKIWKAGARGQFLAIRQGERKKVLSCKDVLQTRCPSGFDPGGFDPRRPLAIEDCQLDTFKGWDGHSIDGSPSLGKRQATGRVDVPVDAIANSFGYVGVAPLHRSLQSVVLVNLGSHVEKKEKTIFVKGVEGKTKVRRVVDTTQIWELLDEGVDMWVAVNGKRVEKDATMSQIGIHDQDTIRCYGRLLGGAQRYRQPPQDIPGQWTCSLCGQERVWPTKNRCFRCGNPKHHDPVSPGPIIGPTGRAPQKMPATNPTYRRDGRQNKIPGQHVPSVVPPRQSPTENVGSNAIPWAPGVRVDLVRELLKNILTNEDYAKYSAQLEPP